MRGTKIEPTELLEGDEQSSKLAMATDGVCYRRDLRDR